MVRCTECHTSTRSDHLARHMERKHRRTLQPTSTAVLPPISGIVNNNNDDISKYVWKINDRVERNHSPIFPRDIRALIVGKSGCGKTVVLAHLLLQPGMLDYDTLNVCGNSLHQPVYHILNKAFGKGLSKNQVRAIFENQSLLQKQYPVGGIDQFIDRYSERRKGGINAQFLEDVADIPDPRDHDPNSKTLLVLDDIMLGPQNKAEAYYTRGRHNNIDTIYITQNYFHLPRQTVRENANLIMLFKQDGKNMNHIHQDHCTDIPFDEFRDFCNDVWAQGEHNFVTINLAVPGGARQGKYRCNFTNL